MVNRAELTPQERVGEVEFSEHEFMNLADESQTIFMSIF